MCIFKSNLLVPSHLLLLLDPAVNTDYDCCHKCIIRSALWDPAERLAESPEGESSGSNTKGQDPQDCSGCFVLLQWCKAAQMQT